LRLWFEQGIGRINEYQDINNTIYNYSINPFIYSIIKFIYHLFVPTRIEGYYYLLIFLLNFLIIFLFFFSKNFFEKINNNNFTFNLSPYINSSMSLIRIDLPIKKYELEDCCICCDKPGQINGLCGHQIVCSSCVKNINSCPVCNSKIIENSELLEKILYI
jgi:hypothetical protein